MRLPPVTASLLVQVLWIQTVVLQCVLSVEVPTVREAGTHHKAEQVPIVRGIGAYCKGRAATYCNGSNVPTVRESTCLL